MTKLILGYSTAHHQENRIFFIGELGKNTESLLNKHLKINLYVQSYFYK